MKTLHLPVGVVFVVALAALASGEEGTITSFNADEGYGFITPDDGGDDVYTEASGYLGSGTPIIAENNKAGYVMYSETAVYYRGPEDVTPAPARVSLGEVAAGTMETIRVLVTNLSDEPIGPEDVELNMNDVWRLKWPTPVAQVGPGETLEVHILYGAMEFALRCPFDVTLTVCGQAVLTLTGTGVPPAQVSAQAAVVKIGEVVNVLQATLDRYLWRGFDVYELSALTDELTDLAGKIAFDCVIDNERLAAAATSADADLMIQALAALEAGELLRLAGAHSQAVAMYECAVALAGSAASEPIDPQAGVQTGETPTLVGEGRKGPEATNVIPG